MKIHSRCLHAPLRGIFGPDSVSVARYASIIGTKPSTKWDAQPTESNFQTRSGEVTKALKASRTTLDAIWNHDEAQVAAAIGEAHIETAHLQYNDENALSYTISLVQPCAINGE